MAHVLNRITGTSPGRRTSQKNRRNINKFNLIVKALHKSRLNRQRESRDGVSSLHSVDSQSLIGRTGGVNEGGRQNYICETDIIINIIIIS